MRISLDLNAGFAFGWATQATAQNQEYLRQCLLDVMIYPLLEVKHLITLHAACVVHRGKGILLAGNYRRLANTRCRTHVPAALGPLSPMMRPPSKKCIHTNGDWSSSEVQIS